MRKIYFLSLLILSFFLSKAQVPLTYYNSAIGLTGSALKQELHDIITAGHVKLSYTPGVWDAYYTTDVYPDPQGTIIWDIYSSNCDSYDGLAPYYYTVGVDQDPGSGSVEGEYYNREHTVPNSWWGGYDNSSNPQYTDLNHLFATDKIVNNKRSSVPYGVVSSPDWTSLNGSELGPNSFPGGFSGTAFEPIDRYKGDVARIYFYMATRYKDEIPTWVTTYGATTDVDLVFSSTGEFQSSYFDMLYEWHTNDPVSQKEIDRDNAVYNEQGNANPYISHPEWVCEALGAGCVVGPLISVSPTSLSGYTYVVGAGPSISQSFDLSGSTLDGSIVTVSAPTNYEVSTDNITFAASVNVSYTAPDLSATTIYVRLKAGLSIGIYNSENVTCMDNGSAENQIVINNGEVTDVPPPTLLVTPTSLTGYTYLFESGPSTSQSFDLSGSTLDGSIVTVSAPANYEVSTDNITFTTSVNVSYTAPDLDATTIYVRLKAGLAIATYNSELVTCSDNGSAADVTVSNNGSVTSNATSTCEDFNTGLASTYTTGSQTLSTGDWTTTSVYAEVAADSRDGVGSAARINDDTGGANLTTPSLNSVGTIDFWYKELNSGGGIFVLQKSTDGSTWIDLTSQAYAGNTFTEFIYDVNDVSNPIYIRILSDNNPGHLIIDDFCWTAYSVSTPTLVVTPTSLSSYTYVFGSGPSFSQSFDLSGTYLDGTQVTVTAPTNYEVSTDGISFGASVNVSYTVPDLSATTIYVRLKTALAVGIYNSELVTCSDDGTAADKTVSNDGEVTDSSSGSFSENVLTPKINIYPNPVKDILSLDLVKNIYDVNVVIYDISGREVISKKVSGRKTEINISSFNLGIYFVEIIFNDKIFRKKIIKE